MQTQVKINLPYDVYKAISDDAKSFGFTHLEDGSPNLNKLVNAIFGSWGRPFLQRIDFQVQQARRSNVVFRDVDKSVLRRLFMDAAKVNSDIDEKKEYPIQIVVAKDNGRLYRWICTKEGQGLGASGFFRSMLTAYLELPRLRREVLAFHNMTRLIEEVSKSGGSIIVKEGDRRGIVIPYGLAEGRLSNRMHLIGVEAKGQRRELVSIPLKDIISLRKENRKRAPLNMEETDFLEMTKSQSAEYPVDSYDMVEVRFSEKGKKKYLEDGNWKPVASSSDGGRFFFACNFNVIALYLAKYGSDAEIVSPEYARDMIKAHIRRMGLAYGIH